MDILLPVLMFLAGLGVGFGVAWFGRNLSARAMAENAQSFLQLAETRFRALQDAGTGELDKRTLAVNELIKPVDAQLKALNNALQQIAGTDKSVVDQLNNLQRETARIAGALNNPRERGRSAEILLERLFEHAGLVRDVNFRTQVVEGDIRPDFVVELKDQLRVVVDAKAPLIDVMDELQDPERQREAAQKLAVQVRAHIKSLAAKRYNDIPGSVDFTVLFLPGDGLYALAVESDRELIDYAAKHNIVLSSPMLLFGLLRMVHALGREKSLNQNAEEIRKLGAELHKRLTKFFDHFQNIGKSLQTLNGRYNDALGSMGRMVLPAARKFEEMQAIPANNALQLPPAIDGPLPEQQENIDDKAA